MIRGHGIDLQAISQVAKAYAKNNRFARKVLTAEEFVVFENLKGQRQMNYLAGRWSAKEAFAKAWGTGIGQISFQDLEVLTNELGAPVFTKHPFSGNVWVSISHSGDLVQSSVILEEKDD